MKFEYNGDELELFETIKRHVVELLENKWQEKADIEIAERYRKFNFSIKARTTSRQEFIHVKSFIYEIKDGEQITYNWVGPVLRRTRAIYEFLEKYEIELSIPQLVVFDDEMDLILTKMVPGKGLHQILAEDDTNRADLGLQLMASALAELHGKTTGLQDEFMEIHQIYDHTIDTPLHWIRWNTERLYNIETVFSEINENSQSQEKIQQLIANLQEVRSVAESSRFISLVNSDPCPDNLLINEDQLTMIDLDTFSFYYSFIDVYYLWTRISCWCVGRLDDDLIDQLENHYLSRYRSFQSITDQEFHFHTILGALLWMAIELGSNFFWIEDGKLSLESDRKWGRSNRKSRFFSRIRQLEERIEKKRKFIPAKHLPLIDSIMDSLTQIRDDMLNRMDPQYLPKYSVYQ